MTRVHGPVTRSSRCCDARVALNTGTCSARSFWERGTMIRGCPTVSKHSPSATCVHSAQLKIDGSDALSWCRPSDFSRNTWPPASLSSSSTWTRRSTPQPLSCIPDWHAESHGAGGVDGLDEKALSQMRHAARATQRRDACAAESQHAARAPGSFQGTANK